MNDILKKLIFLVLIFSSIFTNAISEEKIKIGILIPITGDDKKVGQLIIKATRMAIKDINSSKLEIYPKDTNSNPTQTLKSALELKNMGINIIIGPVFYKNLIHLNDLKDITFLSLTNKTINLPKNIISSGINATSQVNTIKKFLELEKIEKAIFLTPNVDYEVEIKKAIKESKVKVSKHYTYETDHTKLTNKLETITN